MLDINVKDVSLVLEGGTFRTVFTMGILDAFLDEGIMMPHISGVSAGITYAGSYISQQKGRNIQILKKYRHDKRYMGVRNFLTDRSIFGLKFAYDTLVNELEPMDWEIIMTAVYVNRLRYIRQRRMAIAGILLF